MTLDEQQIPQQRQQPQEDIHEARAPLVRAQRRSRSRMYGNPHRLQHEQHVFEPLLGGFEMDVM